MDIRREHAFYTEGESITRRYMAQVLAEKCTLIAQAVGEAHINLTHINFGASNISNR